MKLSKIKPNPNNPRIVKDDKFKKLVKSIKEFPKMMELRPMVIDKEGIVLGGNMRLKALKELGYKDIPPEWVKFAKDLTEEEKKRFIIADNVGFGLWDWDQLANEWDEEQLIDWGLDIPDFETEELEAVEDDYSEPEQMQVDIVEGDLVEFVCDDGRVHRLLCGDSTNSDAVAKLIDKTRIDAVITDPPYGITHSGKGIKGATTENDFGVILGDNDISVAVDVFNYCLSVFKDTVLIFWGANYYCSTLPNGFGWLVWDKEREGNTFSGAELAFVNKGVKLDVFRHQWHGMIKASEHGKKRVHPTQKPIALIDFCINNYDVKKTILDLFLGSGSTLVAAHQLKRTCYGMELDAKYCQVIIDRMTKLDETLTVKINGKEYKKEGAEVPF